MPLNYDLVLLKFFHSTLMTRNVAMMFVCVSLCPNMAALFVLEITEPVPFIIVLHKKHIYVCLGATALTVLPLYYTKDVSFRHNKAMEILGFVAQCNMHFCNITCYHSETYWILTIHTTLILTIHTTMILTIHITLILTIHKTDINHSHNHDINHSQAHLIFDIQKSSVLKKRK